MPAVDPKQLQTWANQGKGGPAPAEEPDMPEEGMEEEMPEEGEDMEAGGASKFASIMEFLEEDADLIETACTEMDQTALMSEDPLSDEDKQKLVSALAFLRPELVEGMKTALVDTTYDEAMDLGMHLQDEGYCEDGDMVGGFLFHAKEALPELTQDHHDAADVLTEQAMADQAGAGAAPEEGMEEAPVE